MRRVTKRIGRGCEGSKDCIADTVFDTLRNTCTDTSRRSSAQDIFLGMRRVDVAKSSGFRTFDYIKILILIVIKRVVDSKRNNNPLIFANISKSN